VLTDEQLPQQVDWRGTGADGPVKDQVHDDAAHARVAHAKSQT
jgi:hypothetical protein